MAHNTPRRFGVRGSIPRRGITGGFIYMSENIYKEITKEMNKVKKWIAKRATVKMHNKLIEAYNSCIDQFYEYKPEHKGTKYVRHYMKKGENGGKNLYRALLSKLDSIDKMMPTETSYQGGIDFDPSKMASDRYRLPSQNIKTNGYYDSDYDGYGKPENVFNAVVNEGIRFPQLNGASKDTLMTFTCEFEGYTGTPREILQAISEDANLVALFIEEAKKEAASELDLKYIEIE